MALVPGASKLLARTWWSLRQALVELAEPLDPRARFAACLRLTSPSGPLSPERVKSLVDGVVAALQDHPTDRNQGEVTRRLGRYLPAEPTEIAGQLRDNGRAVLGRAERAIGLTKEDVHWHPDDTRLVACELLVTQGDAASWTLAGELAEARPATAAR